MPDINRDILFPAIRFGLKVDALGDIGNYTQVSQLTPTNYVFSGATTLGESITVLGNKKHAVDAPHNVYDRKARILWMVPALFKNGKSRIFRQEYLDRTHEFYEKHGGQTIIYAKFLPIIRTFAAFIAGVGKMDYLRFLTFNVVGAIGWVTSMILMGYWLGSVPLVQRNFEKFVLGIIVVSLIPAVLHIFKGSKKIAPVG